MKYSTQIHEQYVIFKLDEEKLISTVAPELKSQLLLLFSQGKTNIILDLSAVQYADSSGLSALLRTHKLCQDSGGLFVITNVQSHVQKLLDISQLTTTLNVLPTNQEGIEAVFLAEIEKDITEDPTEVDEFGAAGTEND